ncbi:MAG: hypothetical protein OJF50_001447 [Nitrospira sp.]|jgi:hypothetical protein|nr:hypothetical protein [Nitrospira sp.]
MRRRNSCPCLFVRNHREAIVAFGSVFKTVAEQRKQLCGNLPAFDEVLVERRDDRGMFSATDVARQQQGLCGIDMA